jgi:mono/diheme cytochrome c family protein/glucose/arabinose dehydrogenase
MDHWIQRIGWGLGFAGWLATSALVLAQSGDKEGEDQPERVPEDLIPPAPVLSPEDQMATFQLPPGFRVELVAAEPLVNTPVAMQFDHQGRLWVVEMTGYMRDPDGTREQEPVGAVVILSDTDGDGQMDQRTVFLDNLVMPRALMLFQDGALIAEPPRVWFARDTTGDGRADEKVLAFENYATQNDPTLGARSNPEHASNGLMWALDNWVYSANHTTRYRYVDGEWKSEPTHFRGQWGLTQDDYGRLFFNSNSDQIRGDFVPGHYLARNPHLKQPYGINVQLTRDQRVWPIRVNPGVNRGYQRNTLRDDGMLANYTGACGPVAYRGDQFPEEFRNNVFLCEPTANLIRRNILVDQDGQLTATNAYPQAEFLASTDERFRPVNLFNGPDGCLYIVDMARGLIQHRIYLTSYLRSQIESRDLQAPIHLGRIYRVVHEGKPREMATLPAEPDTHTLIERLGHPNGWWRDRAQQLLIDRQDPGAVAKLKQRVLPRNNPLATGRLQTLWTLEGLDQLDLDDIENGVSDPDIQVRVAALRLLEPYLQGNKNEAAHLLLMRRAGFLPSTEQLQLLLTLGQVQTPQAETIMRILLLNGPPTNLRIDAAVSGLRGRELEFLEGMLSDPICGPEKAEHNPLVRRLAQCVIHEARLDRIEKLLDMAARLNSGAWQQLAILDGIASTLPPQVRGRQAPNIRPLEFVRQPEGWRKLKALQDVAEVQKRVETLTPLIRWTGDGSVAQEEVTPLTAEQMASFQRGKDLYPFVCGACHQPHGDGQPGLAPPLRDTEWTLGSESRLIRIVLHGMRDAIMVKGEKWELNMPSFGEALEDDMIADLLTYVRREWGHSASPISEAAVRKVREQEAERYDQWTEAELLALP